ncbi:MAG: NusG domain II-containing protein [Treponema sp.]|nr:NusG domain II-containing protein [Treponema sp.]
MKLKIKLPDIFIITMALGLTLFSAYNAYLKPQDALLVLVRGQNSEWFFPLDARETVIVNGPLGETIINISENHAWVESSPCDNHTCEAAGKIFRQGQWAACLPNNVLLMIEGKKSENADTIAW